MCRRTKTACSLLGADPARWPKFEVLPAVAAVVDGFEPLEAAIRHAADGDAVGAREKLSRIDGPAILEWYVEHAQVAGTRRIAVLQSRSVPGPVEEIDRPYPQAKIEAEVFRRDGFRCRYCQRRVLSRSVLKAFHGVVGDDLFQMGPTNASTHGAALAFRAVADHLVARKRGGKTDPANLLTACYPCNFGKAEYSLEELRLEPPRPPIVDAWDGLEALLPRLRAAGSPAATFAG